MKISLLIIAHDEEAHIAECLDSIRVQSQKANEIVLIAHNCTDNTVEIGRKYPEVMIHELRTQEKGPLYARKYGFEKVTGDIIACIDGDSYVIRDWLEHIIQPFHDERVTAVAGYPILLGYAHISHIWFLLGLPLLRDIFHFYFWGANFACRSRDYHRVGGMDTCERIYHLLDLHYPAEDCILSFGLKKYGKISFARGARSYIHPGKFFEGTNRGKKQYEDYRKIVRYFSKGR